ncbi:Rop family plasmid primer RNA-binding protein [Salmonella enterica]|uniref:Rop family plasmid primer RNA-binding protein n=1 Tax=Salmonella enterica TaxID=28901 RepID=UPI002380EFBF|nr:Rop family plasmid primer RNA-binding protein [Salmonella enterica]WDY07562.1 Rop family plasmid primer RNA-binding protein [Salmonella enterica subsp. enterica serovar Derby]
MTKQEKTALNMARFIRSQTLTLLEKLNELDADDQADICEALHDHADESGVYTGLIIWHQ